jgi:NAD(P)-dependent dehydrogenase (short-subunit alcohol dehydrogenase family)
MTKKSGIWVLGATGRIGRAVAMRLSAGDLAPVLVGRDGDKLRAMAESLGRGTTFKVGEALPAIADMISSEAPEMVLNTIGPFTHTALPIARACPPGTHYIDLSNELSSVKAILALHDEAAEKGSILITGAGFGVLATECVVLKLRENCPPATRVRCAAMPDVKSEPGPLGEAFAASIVEGLATGGLAYEAGRLVRTALLGDFEKILLPDGRLVGTASAPSAELEAARRASGASCAVSATSMVPSSSLVRAILRPLLSIFRIAAVRRFATPRIAAIEVRQTSELKPQVSWSYARIEWSSGQHHGWMRTGDAMVFTADVITRAAIRLAKGEGGPGAFTPGAIFGYGLATECGGEIILSGAPAAPHA